MDDQRRSYLKKLHSEMDFVRATTDDTSDIFKFLQDNFFPDEPLNNFFQRQPQTIDEAKVLGCLKDDLTILAKRKGEICGVAINGFKTPHDDYFERLIKERKGTKYGQILAFLYEQDLATNIWSKVKDERIFEMLVLSVKVSERRQNIAKCLMERSVQLAKEKQCNFAYLTCTSTYSAYLAKEMGFESVYKLAYADYKNDEGNYVFKNMKSSHKVYEALYKNIQE